MELFTWRIAGEALLSKGSNSDDRESPATASRAVDAAAAVLRLALPAAQAGELGSSAEIEMLHSEAARLGVFPAVSRNLHGDQPAITRRTLGRNLWLKQEQTGLLALLAEAGIPAHGVKGVDLAAALYPDLSWRWVSDIDIVVEKKWTEAAYDVLRSAGLLPNHNWTAAGLARQIARPELLGPELILTGAKGLMVELHWDWPGDTLPRANLLDQPEHYLVYLCRHAGRHFWSELKWTCDIELFLRRFSAQLNWELFWRTARVSGSERSCAISLELCRRWFAEKAVPGLQQRLDCATARLAQRAELEALDPSASRSHPVWRQLRLAPWPLRPALVRAWLNPPPQDWSQAHHQGRSRRQVRMRRLAHLWMRWVRPQLATVTFPEWLFFLEAYGVLAAMEIARRTMKPQRLLGFVEREPGREGTAWTLEDLRRMAWLMNAAANRQPMVLRCLTRSLALGWMLRRRGADVRLRIGTRKGAGSADLMEAHAWIVWNGQAVNDSGGQAASYTELEIPKRSADRSH